MNHEDELKNELEQARNLRLSNEYYDNTNTQAQMSMFDNNQDENIIKYEIEVKEELNRIEHILRGDKLVKDARGNEEWVKSLDGELEILNEWGVNYIINLLLFSINKHAILTNITAEEINEKVKYFSELLADDILLKYEDMGLDNDRKRNMYPIIVELVTNIFHFVLLRAINGFTSLNNKSRILIKQDESFTRRDAYPLPKSDRGFKMTQPSTWR